MKTKKKKLLLSPVYLVLILAFIVGFGSYIKIANAAATITVNSTADDASNDGECTLREAITAANSDTASGLAVGECIAGSGTDTIQFAISGSGVKTIALLSALPNITSPLTIDGYTQTGASVNTNPAPQGVNTVLTVALDGSSCVGNCDLVITGTNNVVIKGLSVHSFDQSFDGAISIRDSDNVQIEGNFVGVTPAGADAGNGLVGLEVGSGSTNVTLGGSSASQRNVVSGNAVDNPASDNILINDESDDSVSNIIVRGNIVGLNPAADTLSPEVSIGIRVKNGVNGVTIGGPVATDGNLIAGYDSMGVGIIHESDTAGGVANRSVTVRNNVIGYEGDATTNIMSAGTNSGIGVLVLDPTIPSGSDISGVDILDNKISGTGLFGGIGVFNAAAAVNFSDIVIQRNQLNGQGFIGQSGILVGGKVSDVFAAAQTPANSNTITGYTSGIHVFSLGADPQNISVFGNNVTNSFNHGIELCEDSDFNFMCDVEDGPTANDSGDSDSGPNNYMNTPVINSVSQVGDQLTVNFDLDAADSPTDTYRVDFYLNDTADGSGFGEGQIYLGGANSTNGNGQEVTITMDDSLQVTNGVVTATTTAIDPSTTSDFGATSEFSAVLSDNITYEPAPETTPTNQNNSNNQAANHTSGGNLETTGDNAQQMLLIASFLVAVSGIYFLRKKYF